MSVYHANLMSKDERIKSNKRITNLDMLHDHVIPQ